MRETTRKAIAYHEAGHAVAAWSCRLKILKISIIPDDELSGKVRHVSPLKGIRLDIDGSPRADGKAKDAIIICLAGPEAQRRHNPRSVRRWHASSDYDAAVDLALRVCGSGPSTTAYLRWLGIVAKDLINSRWPMVEKVAAELLVREELSAADVDVLLMPKRRPASD